MKTCYLVIKDDGNYLMVSCDMDIVYHTLYEWCTNDAYIDFCWEINENIIENETITQIARRNWENNIMDWAESIFIEEVPFYE